jgi:hypothetical protein
MKESHSEWFRKDCHEEQIMKESHAEQIMKYNHSEIKKQRARKAITLSTLSAPGKSE